MSVDSDSDGITDQLIVNNLCSGEFLYSIQDTNGCKSVPLNFQFFEND